MFDKWQRVRQRSSQPLWPATANIAALVIAFLFVALTFTSIPASGETGAAPPDKPLDASDSEGASIALALRLELSRNNASLQVDGDGVDATTRTTLAATWPHKNGAYDVVAIHQHLGTLRAKYPRTRSLVVVPHDGATFAELSPLMARLKKMFPEITFARHERTRTSITAQVLSDGAATAGVAQ